VLTIKLGKGGGKVGVRAALGVEGVGGGYRQKKRICKVMKDCRGCYRKRTAVQGKSDTVSPNDGGMKKVTCPRSLGNILAGVFFSEKGGKGSYLFLIW